MQLVSQSLKSRAFLLQFIQIMHEFGHIIPWLEGLSGLEYSTSSQYFFDQVLLRLRFDRQEIIPFQFISSDESKEYLGGVLYFERSPENFKDHANRACAQYLIHQGFRYITCLQTRELYRNGCIGTTIMEQSLSLMLSQFNGIWGVVSEYDVLCWHLKRGAQLESPLINKDNLWIISWSE